MSRSVSATEFAARRAAVARATAARGLDALLVFSRGGGGVDFYGDVYYLAKFHSSFAVLPDSQVWAARGHAAVILSADGEATLLSDHLDPTDERVAIDDVRVDQNLPAAIGRTLAERGLAAGRLGIVGRETLTLSWFEQIQQAAGGRLDVVPADEILERERLIKSPAECELMRAAAKVGVGWMAATMGAVQEGATDADAVSEGLRYLVANGGVQYDVAIASGPDSDRYWGRPAIPPWNRSRQLRRGDLVHVDQWGPVDAYYTDMARSTVVGRSPGEAQREVLDGSVGVVEHLIDAARPGVGFGDLARRGDAWLREHGFADVGGDPDGSAGEPEYGFSLFGHSLGLTTERPWIIAQEDTVIEPNMVLAIEAVVGRAGVGSSNFEQTLIVGEDGPEILTAECPTRWWD
jgi:Xaa-Pro aminopeptidase